MQNTIPHFNYSSKQSGYIDTDGVMQHRIKNLDEFYSALGYTADINKTGLLPDEFIWEEYIKDGAVNTTAFLQNNIIKYLSKHSDSFIKKYGEKYESWYATGADAI
jgi:hypothetical protein